MASCVRTLLAQPERLQAVATAGQVLTRTLYAPERQIGQRQRILREVAARLEAMRHVAATAGADD